MEPSTTWLKSEKGELEIGRAEFWLPAMLDLGYTYL